MPTEGTLFTHMNWHSNLPLLEFSICPLFLIFSVSPFISPSLNFFYMHEPGFPLSHVRPFFSLFRHIKGSSEHMHLQ